MPGCHTFIPGTLGEIPYDVKRTLDFTIDLDPFSAIIMMCFDDSEALDPALRAERVRLRDDIEQLPFDRKQQYPCRSVPPLGIDFDAGLLQRPRLRGMHAPLWEFVRTMETVDDV